MDESGPTASPTIAVPAPQNPHVLWRQLVGLVFWAGLLSLAAGGPTGSLLCLTLGGVTFADAWKSGIYKRPGGKGFLNISPMGWGIAMALLFIIAYPTYLLNRNKLRTIEGTKVFYWATIVLGAILIVLLVLSIVARAALRAK
jgi:hypothetical protein